MRLAGLVMTAMMGCSGDKGPSETTEDLGALCEGCVVELTDISPANEALDVDINASLEVAVTPSDATVTVSVKSPGELGVTDGSGQGSVTLEMAGLLEYSTTYTVDLQYACAGETTTCLTETTFFTTMDEPEETTTEPPPPTEIVLVVDDSNSAIGLQEAASAAIPALFEAFEPWEVSIMVASTTPPAPSPSIFHGPADADEVQALLALGTSGSDFEQGLAVAQTIVSRTAWTEAATRVVIFITDEEDCSHGGNLDGTDSTQCYTMPEALTPVDTLMETFGDPRIEFVAHALLDVPLGSCGFRSERISSVVAQTGGTEHSVCSTDYTLAFQEIAASVLAR